jgi:hypothetical protein
MIVSVRNQESITAKWTPNQPEGLDMSKYSPMETHIMDVLLGSELINFITLRIRS